MKKRYITANELLQDAFRLGLEVLQSGFRPDLIVGVWRGGTPVAIAVQEIFQVCGIETEHMAIRTASYRGIAERERTVQVMGMDCLLQLTQPRHRVLLVDDVFDTGLSLRAIIQSLQSRVADCDIRLATPWYKPANNQAGFEPHYFLHETVDWLVFPHELDGLSAAEISRYKPEVRALLDEYGL